MKPLKPSAKIVVVANPCDVLTYFAQKLSGLPEGQVFGSGTFLDTVRLRNIIAKKVGVADTAVHAYVMGEHGDSQFVAWNSANIACAPIDKFVEIQGDQVKADIASRTKNKAYDIIKAKGATYFGIATVVSSICETICLNQKHVRPLSVYLKEYEVCISVPCVLGCNGIEAILPLNLNELELSQLKTSALSLHAIIKKYEPELSK